MTDPTKTNTSIEDRRTPRGEGQPKRLFKIRDGAMLTGVCNGFAVYYSTDPSLVRVIFVILAVFTHGLVIALYILLSIVVPSAITPEDFASARGDKPNPYGMERRSGGDPGVVNSRAYWGKLFNDQKEFVQKFIKKYIG